ncbi:MAG: ATP-binding cassette domain-containing protein [Candidatus Omnitrophota bacterium]|nr:ATP-binding cassette domain-containing protein [Candidatus Omnitrophota bacterium]MDZ4241968.1 ATP-binding cassette domain-containing protein [Candidatus Omnitrophota bacterium]
MALISLQDISIAFGGPLIFDKLSLQLEPGERVALLGRNGAGKTTLMRVIAGHFGADEGQIVRQQGLEVTHLPQEIPADVQGNLFDIVASGLGKRGEVLKEYHHISHRLHTEHTPELMRRLDRVQAELDRTESWDINNQVESVLSHMKLDPEADFEKLSGGQKRRALLARALVIEPDILLLDEPTNHLDIDSINWLEEFLKKYSGTLLFVTHDRMFMRHLATRIVELDRGRIFSWDCDYDTFLQRKQMALENEDVQRAEFEKKLAQEEVWIRQGVKARRVRNEGRVKALERMREVKKAQRQAVGKVNMQAQEAERSGHSVIKAANLGYWYDDKCLFKNFSTNVMRGDKIGLIGPNGSGKTTLLRLLLGKMEPLQGKVRLGTNLEIAYYDQLREQLDEEKTVAENICGNSDTLMINGKPRHIIGYMQDFLFSPDRVRTPVKVLSGGERNRLLLARLFTKPSNVLVMDEPTNDLDVETLELLEELLSEYPGTILLVSHDRAFLNNVVTSTIVLEGDGEVNEYPGGYDDWLSQRKPKAKEANPRPDINKEEEAPRPAKPRPRKLSYKEEQELAALPAQIEKLEAEQDELYQQMTDPAFFKKPPAEITQAKARLEQIEDELLKTFTRWEFLEDSRQAGG